MKPERRTIKSTFSIRIGLIGLLLLLDVATANALRFEPLGIGSIMPAPGQNAGSVPTDLSADGSVVVGWVYESIDSEITEVGTAFRWEDGSLEAIPQCATADSVSADGSVVAGRCNEDLYWRDGQLVSAGVWDMIEGGSIEIVSGDGMVLFGGRTVVYLDDFNQSVGLSEAHVLAPTTVRIGGLPGDKMSKVVGASFDGSVAAVASRVQQLVHPENVDVLSAARWNGTLSNLGKVASNPDVFPIDVSSDGSTVIGFNGRKPWRWTQSGGMKAIEFPQGGNVANARGVNEDGTMIVGAWAGPSVPLQRAYIWTEEGGSRDLEEYFEELGVDIEGWHLAEATVISDDGTSIAGIGFPPDSNVATGWRVGEGCELRIEVARMFVRYAAAPRQYEPAAGGDYPAGST